ncbi:uncharacterized protein LOC128222342 [Mya arenaria]|uniref:uncharacterized protein LOC128222342 n=1 Tax=Mya arenaria TaxID=6604 RepID=UPI0022E07D9D|nr:uncharacterized protein LOC128222342 [Mya arenaria]
MTFNIYHPAFSYAITDILHIVEYTGIFQECHDTTVSSPNILVCSQCCRGDLCASSMCGNTGYPINTGPVCYSCPYPIDQSDLCDTIRICNRNEKCGFFVNQDGRFEVKCMPDSSCNQAMTTSSCARCCDSQLCNSACDNPNATNIPTSGTRKT